MRTNLYEAFKISLTCYGETNNGNNDYSIDSIYIYIHLCTWYVHVQIYQSIDQHFWMTLLVEQFWLSFLILQLTTVGSQIVWAIVNSILKIGNIFHM